MSTLSTPEPLSSVDQDSVKLAPTKDDYASVRRNYKNTKECDFEKLLSEHHNHLIKKRDEIYETDRQNGVTDSSSDAERLDTVGKVVSYCYTSIQPPNDYTAKTDRKHFRDVAVLGVEFWKQHYPNVTIPPTLIIAAWFHDMERFIPQTKCKYLNESVDKYRKQMIHPLTSARVAMVLLKGAPLTKTEKKLVFELILHHEKPIDAGVIVEDEKMLDEPPDKIKQQLEILIDADSYAFFKSTICVFVSFKSEKHSKEWIWQRIVANVNRLRPHLQNQAIQSIYKLPNDIKDKIAIDYNYLESITTTITTKENTNKTREDSKNTKNIKNIVNNTGTNDNSGDNNTKNNNKNNQNSKKTSKTAKNDAKNSNKRKQMRRPSVVTKNRDILNSMVKVHMSHSKLLEADSIAAEVNDNIESDGGRKLKINCNYLLVLLLLIIAVVVSIVVRLK